MIKFLKKTLAEASGDLHMRELMQGASTAFLLKVTAAGLAFMLNVVLARLLGAEGSGVFFLSLAIVVVVATLGRIGMENALVKFIASNMAVNRKDRVIGVYNKAIFYSFCTAGILSIFLYLVSSWLGNEVFGKPGLEQTLRIMTWSVIPLALLTLHSSALQGLKKITSSISTLSIFVPLITSLISIGFVSRYGIVSAAIGYVIATIATLFIGRVLWKSATESFKNDKAYFDKKKLFSTSMSLFGVVVMNMIIVWSPLLLLGVWEESRSVGVYSAASRTALLTSFILIAVNSIAAPKFASLYKIGDKEGLESVARKTAKIMFVLALPVLIVFLSMPEMILKIFGDEFKEGAAVLMILAIGQFVNVATGSVGYLLMMTGNERLMRNNLVLCAAIGVGLCLLLIPRYGAIGAATSTAIVMATQNIIAMYYVWRKLGILTISYKKS